MKTLLITTLLSFTLLASNNCESLIGDYINCTSGDIDTDATLDVSPTFSIIRKHGFLNIDGMSVDVNYGVNQIMGIDEDMSMDVDVHSFCSTDQTLAVSFDVKHFIFHDSGISSWEKAFMESIVRDIIDFQSSSYSLNGDILSIEENGLVDAIVTCTKVK